MQNSEVNFSMIKKNDFIELEYTGIVKETSIIFDTTNKMLAQKSGIFNPKIDYTPAVICVGQNQLIAKLDDHLIGKEINKEYDIDLNKAFGAKDAKLLKFVSRTTFKKQNVNPEPGMQVQIDGHVGSIRTVNGGRILVDFNNPLASKDITYKVKVNKVLDSDEEKVKALIKLELRIKPEHITFKDGIISVNAKTQVPKELTDILTTRIQTMIPSVKSLEFNSKVNN